ncbi:MAG: heat-inducible transcription repressor HrcA [Deltaproteobacteria bacterium]|nr:heat-inducible transcription repressor HrcA [Deltaproteobacteria bacterium]
MKTDRRHVVLGTLVKMFVRSGEPVPSSEIVRGGGLDCSAATVRNIFGELAADGLVHQPHASAGRVPTDEGFRVFVRDLMEPAGLEDGDAALIESGLTGATSFRDCLPQGSKLAAMFSSCAGLVLSPVARAERLGRIEFLRLRRNELVAIIVTESGDVRHRHLVSPEEVETAELERFNNYLNSILHGLTLAELRERVAQELRHAQDEYDRLRTAALKLAGQTLAGVEAEDSGGRLIVEGLSSVLTAPELSSDEKRLRAVMELLEERSRLARLLERVARDGDGRVRTLIGSETGIDGFPAALVVAGYGPEGSDPIGIVGVLGTPRMDYERILPAVTYLAARLTRAAGDAGLA